MAANRQHISLNICVFVIADADVVVPVSVIPCERDGPAWCIPIHLSQRYAAFTGRVGLERRVAPLVLWLAPTL